MYGTIDMSEWNTPTVSPACRKRRLYNTPTKQFGCGPRRLCFMGAQRIGTYPGVPFHKSESYLITPCRVDGGGPRRLGAQRIGTEPGVPFHKTESYLITPFRVGGFRVAWVAWSRSA